MLSFRTIGIDRPFTILLFRMIGIGTSTLFIDSVLESKRRWKTARLDTIDYSSPFFIHAAHPSSPAENPRKRRCVSLLCPKKLGGWSQQQGGDYYVCVFDANLKRAVF